MKRFTAVAAFVVMVFIGGRMSAQEWLWARNGSCTTTGEGYSISYDPFGNIYVAGFTSLQGGSVTFFPFTLSNPYGGNLFLVKYNSAGNVIWAKTAGGFLSLFFYIDIATDVSGNIYVTGTFAGDSVYFDSHALSSNFMNMFIAKYDSAGNVIWVQQPEASSDGSLNTGRDITTDAAGNVYVTGSFTSDELVFGPFQLHTFTEDMLVVKYNTNGNVLWAKTVDESYFSSSSSGNGIALDNLGDIYLTGLFYHILVIGGQTLTPEGQDDVYIIKYDATGNFVWVKSVGGTSYDEGIGIAANAVNNIFITGYYSYGVNFGNDTLTSSDGAEMFLAKYDAFGNVLWAKGSVGTGLYHNRGYSLAVDPLGNVFVSGGFDSTHISFDSITLQGSSDDPMFIVKYDESGNVLCASSLSSGGDDKNDITIDPDGDLYLFGDYASTPFIVGNDTFLLTGTEDPFLAKFRCNKNEGVGELINNNSFSLSPNPVQNLLTINFLSPSPASGGMIAVYDVAGRKIVLLTTYSNKKAELTTTTLPNGIYLLQIINTKTGMSEVGKFVKE
ncbi:MAG TPA: T9SS type A sorting domain-containing protein [Chitinophagales bacterium]|nr:T9SS type A sorting domain-containing protein [Chitinophagales bacterium]